MKDNQSSTQLPNGAPIPAREAIRAAIKEHKDKLTEENSIKASDGEDDEVEDESSEQEDTDEKSKELKEKDVDSSGEPEKTEGSEDEVDEKEDKEKVEAKKADKTTKKAAKESTVKSEFVPLGLPKDIRDKWKDIPSEAQLYIAKSMKEVNDTKAEVGRIVSQYREYDTVLAPYLPQMQKLGVTPVSVINRLLQYSDALAGPQKYQALQVLARDFGIDLTKFGNTTKNNQQDPNEQEQYQDEYYDQSQQDTALNQKVDLLLNEFSTLKKSQQTANDKAAEQNVNSWAGFDPLTGQYSNKPYFPYVRQSMFTLLKNGTVPITNGVIDLDAAYDAACYFHPEIRERMAKDSSKANAKTSKNKEADLQRAKQAGSSIKTSARIVTSQNVKVSERKNENNNESVRDSLRKAVSEHAQN